MANVFDSVAESLLKSPSLCSGLARIPEFTAGFRLLGGGVTIPTAVRIRSAKKGWRLNEMLCDGNKIAYHPSPADRFR